MSDTATTETLHCQIGNHEWSRPRVRGVKPKSCPEHKPQPQRSGGNLSQEERTRRMQEGRRAKKAERDVEGIERVRAYREFIRLDREYYEALNAKRSGDDEVVVPRKPQWVAIPTKSDYEAAGAVIDTGLEEAA